MSVLRNSIKSKITLCQEWLDTLDRDEFLRLFINLKPRGLHGNFKSQVWNYFGALCQRNVAKSDDSASDFLVLDDNFNYCRLCLAKQQHVLRLEEQDWTCIQSLPVIRGLANNIKCYRTNTATGALSDHLLHDHGLEYSKKHGSDMLVANTSPSENGHKLLKSGSFPINQDILLLQEVLAHNPFSSNPADNKVWEKIARSVSATDEDFILDGFRCQKRTNLLMDLFKQGDSASLRSVAATEQQHREREQLLQRLVDMENEGMMPPVTKRLKLENDEGNELDGWDMSINTSLNNSLDDMPGAGASAESSDDTIITSGLKPKKHERLYSKKTDFVSYSLAKKELQVREKELALKREQLELQKQQLQFDRDRFAAEQQERAMRYQTEKEEREARLKLESEERRTLMEILKHALIKS